ncbi:Uncharacterized protein Pro_0868 [Prochlorococcus marinus subsp. marinus str. CCMP1375]|uniref:Uncharacterized protein n=2 Tax=Prochlorococcaceae TaxID=2881426 RepID=Q7VC74_PROMA|nr:Uncharacterized protein Pro_0868 [Prochlorococcus marinus subsp. marinus str. CCMP1375]
MDYLRISHLYFLALKKQPNRLASLHLLLLKNWLSRAEDILPAFLMSKKQPICLVAVENNELIASINIKPINKRGTSWSFSLPKCFSEPKWNTPREIKLRLIKASLELEPKSIQNWLIKCPSSYIEELSILRELGFQPQKMIRSWSINLDNKDRVLSYSKAELPNSFRWEKINKDNARLLWKIELAGESVNYREIIDRQSTDLIEKANKFSGVLISKEGTDLNVIAGLIPQDFPEDQTTLKLIRDLVWDSRLTYAIPEILKTICINQNEIIIETNSKDDYVNNILKSIGLEPNIENIILGKSNLRRKNKTAFSSNFKTIEGMLGELNPGNSPLPSPSITPPIKIG